MTTWRTAVILAVIAPVAAAATPQSDSPAVRALQGADTDNLLGTPLKPCGTGTGFDRTGSCDWDPSDSGFHQVCVKMSDEFLNNSATEDGNDLSSVVQNGGYWCICAWAWASAVTRDATSYEGLQLQCDRTNGRLREVYSSHMTLQSPCAVSDPNAPECLAC